MGTKIVDVMTRHPRAVETDTSVREAARLMEGDDVGSLPVVETEGAARLVGVLTDRDIALRVVAAGRDPETTRVSEVASRDVVTVTPDDDLDEALTRMARSQVRRLPVVVGDGELVGMLSQADLPRVTKEKNVGEVVGAISRPPRGPRISGGDLAETDPADASGQTSSPSGTESRLDEESKR
jgi:CBS domain-containing protein